MVRAKPLRAAPPGPCYASVRVPNARAQAAMAKPRRAAVSKRSERNRLSCGFFSSRVAPRRSPTGQSHPFGRVAHRRLLQAQQLAACGKPRQSHAMPPSSAPTENWRNRLITLLYEINAISLASLIFILPERFLTQRSGRTYLVRTAALNCSSKHLVAY